MLRLAHLAAVRSRYPFLVSEPQWYDIATEGAVRDLFSARGVKSMYVKELSRNHNSKNQIYLAPDLSELALIPAGPITSSEGTSRKLNAGAPIFHASVDWTWLSPKGESRAPNAQLIYYPQYPEVRLSGLLLGSPESPRDLLSIESRGQELGRLLLFGSNSQGRIFGQLLSRVSPAARSLTTLRVPGEHLSVLPVDGTMTANPDDLIVAELARIHRLGWIDSCELHTDGTFHPCRGPRCGGHTLEASMGIPMNGVPGPDFGEWEVKSHRVARFDRPASGRVTLFTPEPDVGAYAENGVSWFAEHFGRLNPDANRYDFTGVHTASNSPHPSTGLRLVVDGYDPQTRDMMHDGVIGLIDPSGALVSGWTFSKLLSHWQRKHALAAYVPSLSRKGDPAEFSYGNLVHLARRTRFEYFLRAMSAGEVVYDPGIKLEQQPSGSWKAKARSQFRINFRDLGALYESFDEIDVLSAD
jgi:hypothetical protein